MNRLILAALAVTLISACAAPTAQVPADQTPSSQYGYAPVNGIEMYFEIHGAGGPVPLVLLNGGGSTIDVTYGRLLPILAGHRKVIALEEQGHGRTSDRQAPFRATTSADDISALLKILKVPQADILGFSNGAGVAMEMAIRHPDQVRKLVFVSYFTKKSGAQPWFWGFMKKADFAGMPQPLKDAFQKVNPNEAALENMCAKDIERMQHFKEIPDSDVRSIKAPTLILIGDQDVVTPEHAAELHRKIANSRLVILPGAHGEFLGELLTGKPGSRAPEHTAGFIEEFLGE